MPEKQKSGGRQPSTRSTVRPSSRPASQDAVPDIYREMLAEAALSLVKSDIDGKTVKKRRVGGRLVTYGAEGAKVEPRKREDPAATPQEGNIPARVDQTIYNDSAESSGEDLEWEEVNLNQDPKPSLLKTVNSLGDDVPLEIHLGVHAGKGKAPAIQRRKPVTGSEKRMRLDVHKAHLLCLIAHVYIRNHWCNDIGLQEDLRPLISARTRSYLHPDVDKGQFQRSEMFMAGLQQVFDTWKTAFEVTERGMRRTYWAEDTENLMNMQDDFESTTDKDEFISKAKNRTGSRDSGAQLLCALLRSVAVEARLVCSLQPLSFLGVTKGMTPQKPQVTIIDASDLEDHGNSNEDTSGTETISKPPIPPPRMRRLGRPEFREPHISVSIGRPPTKDRPKRPKESPHPVFWVEALDESKLKWIPIDPIVTHTIGKAQKFEPPSKDSENNLSYVIAFEEDGSVRDITRRYSKSFNAKTRKNRVESTKDGERWWRRTMNFYKKPFQEDRDQIEAGELAAKEAREPMPKNVQDFKNHPLYALERHLKRNEVVHPRREIGKMGAGTIPVNKADGGTESVFRRRDIHVVRSAEGWYRLGREIRSGEQPLKRAPRRRNKGAIEDEDEMIEEDPSVGLYAEFQTDLYKPPPVVDGRIPRNVYGNLDVYCPSMVPEGGFHLPDPRSVRAATLLGIDYAEAVAGFEFKGRQGHAVFRGVVAALDYQDALFQVLEAFEDEEIEAQEEKRTLRALSMWKRLLLRLRIKERVEEHVVELGREEEIGEEIEIEDGGGFFPDVDRKAVEPTAHEAEEMGSFHEEDGGCFTHGQGEIADVDLAVGNPAMADPPPDSIPMQRTNPSPRKEKPPPRYILHVRSLDEPDPYSNSRESGQGSETFTTLAVVVGHHSNETDENEDFPVTMSEALPSEAQQPDTHKAATDEFEPASSPRKEALVARNMRVEDTGSELEESSLLSHDPEDEDADPEWVVEF